MIIHTNSFRYLWEVLEGNEYGYLFNNLRVLDLGCNVGAFALWIYPFTERLWCVDCEQKHLDNLNKTIKDNELKSIVTIKEKVVDVASLMSGQAIDFVDILKIDIEGDEYKVFDREDFPKDRIRTIIGEYHKDVSPEVRLTSLGYRYTELPNRHFIARR